MQRKCDVCSSVYQAKRATSRYCGSACRVRATRLRAAGTEPTAKPLDAPSVVKPPSFDAEDGLVGAIRRQLSSVDRLDSILGQQALVLAARLSGAGESTDSGASLASVSKELRAVMVEALAGVAIADDPVDELRLRRELKLSG